jgi:hypothetical protein
VRQSKEARTINLSTATAAELGPRIDAATAGLQPYLNRALRETPPENAKVICDYVLAMQSEINPTLRHRKNLVFSLLHFSAHLKHKAFEKITKEDILGYLDSYRRTEEADPMHKWIGTYNVRRGGLVKFFRWLYHPDSSPEDREIPAVLYGIRPKAQRSVSLQAL